MPIDFTQLSTDELSERFQKLQDKLAHLEKSIAQQISSQPDVTSEEYDDVKASRVKEFEAAQRAFEEISQRYEQVKKEYDQAQKRLREATRLVREVDREAPRDVSKTRKDTRTMFQQEIKDIRAELRAISQSLEKAGRQDSVED